MRYRYIIGLIFFTLSSHLVAQFAPPVGQAGTTAMHKDSSAFISWASHCIINRGYQDISDASLGYASVGDSTSALGIAGTTGVVSLGDGGSAIITFNSPVKNDIGYDFAVFENSFNDSFLELAFVEVSSDGINFFRFPAVSYIQDTLQTGSFDSTDATLINNLAGKYRAMYGTPFDLEELEGQEGLDIDHVSHIKIIDVVGSIQNMYATFDRNGKKINDPWNTPYASGGFDLDAVGVIHDQSTGIEENNVAISSVSIYPNPVVNSSEAHYYLKQKTTVKNVITDITGRELKIINNEIQSEGWNVVPIKMDEFNSGIYLLRLQTNNKIVTQKIIYTK